MRFFNFCLFALLLATTWVHGADKLPEQKPLSSESVYQLDSPWINQTGHEVKLSGHRGKPLLMTMVYTSCQYSCPMVIEALKKILKQLPAADQNKAGVLLVSFDTESDTPEKMRQFAEKKGLDPATWTFLKGSPSAIREVAAVLGINYKKTEDGNYTHTNTIAVLDSEGVIRYRQSSLGGDGKSTAGELRKLIPPGGSR